MQWPPFLLASMVLLFFYFVYIILFLVYEKPSLFLSIYLVFHNVNGQVPIAVDMAKDSNGKDRDLKKRIENDYYFSCAIEECYASCKNIINELVNGEQEKRYPSYTCFTSPRLYLLNLGEILYLIHGVLDAVLFMLFSGS